MLEYLGSEAALKAGFGNDSTNLIGSLTPGILSMGFGAWGTAGLRAAGKTGFIRDPKSIVDFTLSEKLDLQIKHQALISRLRRGDVTMPSGSMSARLMGELTVATGSEVALIRIGRERLLRLGGADSVYVGDASRLIAHTHPSGVLQFSVGVESDIAVFTNIDSLRKQLSGVLIAPDGTAGRLPIIRP